MDKNSPVSNSELLNRVRQSIESQPNKSTERQVDFEEPAETPDQILEKLKAKLGESANDTDSHRESDYDISGFEIESVEDMQTDNGAEEDGTDLDSEPLSAKETVVEDSPQVETRAQQDKADAPESNDTDESRSSEEGIRQRVAHFVEQTVNPEEDFDYFAEMDRIASKRKEVSATIEKAEINAKEENNAVKNNTIESADTVADEICREENAFVTPVEQVEPPAEDPKEDLSNSSCINHSPNPFFFSSQTKKDENGKTRIAPPAGYNSEAELLDDTDINLLLALGKKNAVEDSIGFVRVREAKNNFYDPTEEEPFNHNTFAYDGQEFRSYEQTATIKTRYRKEKKRLYKRMVGTLLLTVLLLFVELVTSLAVTIPFVSDFLAVPLQYCLVNFALLMGGLLLSSKSIWQGLQGFFTMRPNQHTPVGILCAITVIYNIFLVSFFKESEMLTYNSALLVFLSLSIIGDAIRLTKEIMTFDIVSDEKEKFSLEKSDTSPELFHEKRMLYKRDLLVERVSFVGKYFTRTARRPAAFTQYFIELLIVLVLAIFVGILTAFTTRSLSHAFHIYTLVLFVCIPMQYLIYDIYALQKLSKILYRHESAIIGENADSEYVGANTVYLDDIEMFGHHGVSISRLRIYDEKNFHSVLYLAHAVFSKMEGPLHYVLENNTNDIKEANEVKLENIHKNGIEATVDSDHKVFIGNVLFMRSNGFFPKQNEDDEKKVESGEACILHMAVNGVLCAKFYMKYTITQRFEKFLSEMKENHTRVGIRTLDPNVTEKMIALLRGDEEQEISVIRPTLNDLVPLGRRADSSIITAKSPHMISRILAQCAHLKKIRRVGIGLRCASSVIGLIGVALLPLTASSFQVPPLFVALYQLIWLIPSIIYIKLKLK